MAERYTYANKLRSALRRIRRAEEGGATVESVLWLPVFILFFMMVFEVSMVFQRQTDVLRVVQDSNRALSVGRLSSTEDLMDAIENRIAYLSTNATVSSTIDGGVVTTEVLIPINDLVVVGMFGFLSNYNVGVNSQQFIEY